MNLKIALLFFVLLVPCIVHPMNMQEHYHAASVAKDTGNITQAIVHYEHIITEQPSDAYAHLQIAQLYLMQGRFIEGWQELEWHLGYKPEFTRNAQRYIETHQRLDNKIVLLSAEWGIGDTLWLMRYAKTLKERGARVIIHVLHDSLIPLLQQQPYFDEILPRIATNIPCHFEIPMMSLPMVFKTTVESIPSEVPYLQIDQQRVDAWRNMLALPAHPAASAVALREGWECFAQQNVSKGSKFKIGICWHGNTIHGQEKFMPLSYFAQLAQLPNVSLYSLQQHHGLDQIDELEDKTIIHTFDKHFDAIPFLDTAAVMKNLDLIITVDTSIAHLAGALGVPVWVILPASADWRWMLDRNDCPWYPSMKLFRQKDDWQEITQSLKDYLQVLSVK